MKVYWTQNAIKHLTNIYEYIALNSPTYARRMVDRIADGSQGAVINRTDDHVVLPFGLVALYWIKVFKPLVLDKEILQ